MIRSSEMMRSHRFNALTVRYDAMVSNLLLALLDEDILPLFVIVRIDFRAVPDTPGYWEW
jgi:hypothetical protein